MRPSSASDFFHTKYVRCLVTPIKPHVKIFLYQRSAKFDYSQHCTHFLFVLASTRMRVKTSIGFILLFVYAFAQTKLSVFNTKLHDCVCSNSDPKVILWFFGHTVPNSLLLLNLAMTALNMSESQYEI
jgi:hypothetical protein